MNNNAIKAAARATLKGFWLRILVVFATIQAVSAIFSLLATVVALVTTGTLEDDLASAIVLCGSILSTLLTTPLTIGYKHIMWRLTEGDTPSVSAMFELFGDTGRLIKCYRLALTKWVIIALPSVVVIVPSAVFEVLIDKGYAFTGQLEAVGDIIILISALLVFVGVYISVVLAIKFFLTDYIFISDEKLGVVEILRRSSDLMKGNAKRVVSLTFSFTGWFLLGMTGIGELYSAPYFDAACAVFARMTLAAEDYKQRQTTDQAIQGVV